MLAFFDTSIHIDVLRGTRLVADVLEAAGNPPVRLSPVVASELLWGRIGTRGFSLIDRNARPM
jgi:predicted nucleic acid-binding protein